ncbi:MAG: DUF3604 domain-containing protein [Acidobacteria bacterium]|nr:DUF3604 domain-containing protein [Acidobacteriota bacterium]
MKAVMSRLLLALMAAVVLAAQPAPPIALNADSPLLAALPSFTVRPGGATCVWSAYDRGREWMLARAIEGGRPARIRQVSPGEGVYCQPRVLAAGAATWAFWTRQWRDNWQVLGTHTQGGEWAPVTVLSEPGENSMAAAAGVSGTSLVLAFEAHAKPQRIKVRVHDGERWSPAAAISRQDVPSYRPAVAVTARGEAWVFWDSYLETERANAVFGRRVLPAETPVERISPPGRSCLKPVALEAARTGLAVAWVATQDVIGGEGVLDHWDTIQVATRAGGKWTSAGGEVDIASLQHGLLSRMEPEFISVWGYAGRRRHPMLAEEDGALWLLWERRISPDGRAHEPGQLCGRRFDGAAWGDPLILHEGLVEYALAENPRAERGSLPVIGKDIRHVFQALAVPLRAGQRIEDRPWPGWKPVQLPRDPAAPRRSIEIGGRRHLLYWGDLHVHSILTPDAEGEVDELMHFARDKARLDVVVMQENDSNSWSRKAFVDRRLSASEYALSVYFSRRYTEPGRFVALPGWEWSQRTADDDRSNHRTVLFAGEDTPIVRHTENGGNFDELCDMVEAAGGTMFTQHEAFRLTGRRCDSNIEVATGWSNYLQPPDKIHRELSAGHKVGFVATSDGHRRNPGTGGGLTGIYAPELTPRAILEAIQERRVYATTGARVFLDARANGVFMGNDIVATGDVRLTLRVAAPRAIARVVLVRNGAEIHVEPGRGRTGFDHAFTDRPGSGFHWYYWRVELEGTPRSYAGNSEVAEGHLAWSSPHRVQVYRR